MAPGVTPGKLTSLLVAEIERQAREVQHKAQLLYRTHMLTEYIALGVNTPCVAVMFLMA